MSTNIEKGSKAETAENLSNSDLTHSLQSKKQEISETASWKMKAFVLLSILSLPGKYRDKTLIKSIHPIFKWDVISLKQHSEHSKHH